MSSSLQPLKNTLSKLVNQLHSNPQGVDYQRYFRLMQSALPENWRNSVSLINIESGIWYLGVRSQQEAYLLRFLAPEIEQRLAQKLPNPPTIRIHIDPNNWIQNQRPIAPAIHITRKRYSTAESRQILDEFFTRLQQNRSNR